MTWSQPKDFGPKNHLTVDETTKLSGLLRAGLTSSDSSVQRQRPFSNWLFIHKWPSEITKAASILIPRPRCPRYDPWGGTTQGCLTAATLDPIEYLNVATLTAWEALRGNCCINWLQNNSWLAAWLGLLGYGSNLSCKRHKNFRLPPLHSLLTLGPRIGLKNWWAKRKKAEGQDLGYQGFNLKVRYNATKRHFAARKRQKAGKAEKRGKGWETDRECQQAPIEVERDKRTLPICR